MTFEMKYVKEKGFFCQGVAREIHFPDSADTLLSKNFTIARGAAAFLDILKSIFVRQSL